jgi:phage-related protein
MFDESATPEDLQRGSSNACKLERVTRHGTQAVSVTTAARGAGEWKRTLAASNRCKRTITRVYFFWYTHSVSRPASPPLEPTLTVIFYRSSRGKEPVRDWLKALVKDDRRIIGEDIKTVQFSYPVGMPLVRKLDPDLWEVRSHLSDGIARTLFTVQNDRIVLLHAFVKKSQKTPATDLALARKRLKAFTEDTA